MEAALKKTQEKMKQQANRRRKEAEMWKAEDEIMLSMKNLVI